MTMQAHWRGYMARHAKMEFIKVAGLQPLDPAPPMPQVRGQPGDQGSPGDTGGQQGRPQGAARDPVRGGQGDRRGIHVQRIALPVP